MKKILIVDDEMFIVEVLKDTLQENGYEVLIAMDGMQGTMQAVKNKPDLILLDISMPAGGGMSVYNRLKQSVETQAIPVIFMSAMPPADLVQKVPDDATVFHKPFKQKDLLAAVKDESALAFRTASRRVVTQLGSAHAPSGKGL